MSISNASSSTFSCDTRIGITFIAQSACLSCAAVVSLLSYVAYNAFRHRGTQRGQFLRSHLDLYLLGLLLSDLVQSIGGIMDIRWIAKSGVFEGRFCTAQGILEQFGDVGVALCSMAIATHTFAKLILRWKEPRSFTLPLVVLSLYAIFLTLIVGIGYAVHRHSVYYGNTTYWCWIRKNFLAEGIGLEYAFLWLAAAMNLLLYIPAFLALKHIIDVEPTDGWSRYRVKLLTKEERQRAQLDDGQVNPGQMLYYPAVYIVTVLPIAVVRIHAFISTAVPFPATVFSGILFSASGFFNVVVYTSTRPTLLRPPAFEADAPVPRHQPKVFFYPDQDQSDIGTPSGAGEGGERQPSPPPPLVESGYEMEPVRHELTINTRDLRIGEAS